MFFIAPLCRRVALFLDARVSLALARALFLSRSLPAKTHPAPSDILLRSRAAAIICSLVAKFSLPAKPPPREAEACARSAPLPLLLLPAPLPPFPPPNARASIDCPIPPPRAAEATAERRDASSLSDLEDPDVVDDDDEEEEDREEEDREEEERDVAYRSIEPRGARAAPCDAREVPRAAARRPPVRLAFAFDLTLVDDAWEAWYAQYEH